MSGLFSQGFRLLILVTTLCLPGFAGAVPQLLVSASFAPDAVVADAQGNAVSTFSWAVNGHENDPAASCSILGVPGITFGGGSGTYTVTTTTSLDAYVECEGGVDVVLWQATGSASLNVQPQPLPPTVDVSFLPTRVVRGYNSTLTWHSQWTTACSSNELPDISATSGSLVVFADTTKTITVTCTGPLGVASASTTLTVLPAGRPQVVIFPGTGGTRLYENSGSLAAYPVWVNFPGIPGEPLDWNSYLTYNMELAPAPTVADPYAVRPAHGFGVVAAGTSNDGLDATGCLINYIFGACLDSGVYLLDMATAFRNAGYDIKIIPYDWRMAWTNHYPAIQQAIDEAYERGQNELVYVVGHSQGTQLARAFLADHPEYRSKIAMVFNVGAPNLGSPVATQYNTPATGGSDFGFSGFPFFLSKATGLRLGGYTPSGYPQNPSREALQIMRYNTGRWMFSEYDISGVTATRLFPAEDTVESAQSYMRSLATSQIQFDRGVQIQEAIAAHPHYIRTYQIISLDRQQDAAWTRKNISPGSASTGTCYYCGYTLTEVIGIPSDGTIPTFSSLGQFSGGTDLGTFALSKDEPNSEHEALVRSTRVLGFIQRAIAIDRGGTDASFASDFPLMTDDQILQHIGWSLPAAGLSTLGTKRVTTSAVELPANNFEFSTPEVEATITLTLTDLITQEQRVYQATKAGIEFVGPKDEPASGPQLHFSEGGDSSAPVLTATSSALFRDGFGDDMKVAADAIAGDLNGLDLHVPLVSDACQVTISADRDVSGTVRVSHTDLSVTGAKVVLDAGVPAGQSLRYLRDSTTDLSGTLYRGVDVLPMTDDTVIP